MSQYQSVSAKPVVLALVDPDIFSIFSKCRSHYLFEDSSLNEQKIVLSNVEPGLITHFVVNLFQEIYSAIGGYEKIPVQSRNLTIINRSSLKNRNVLIFLSKIEN